MDPIKEHLSLLTRRHFFKQGAMGLGAAALGNLIAREATDAAPLGPLSKIAPKAKRAIYLFMAGAPSCPDLLDHKPKMVEKFGVDLRKEVYPDGSKVLRTRTTTMTSGQASYPIAPSMYKFTRHGKCRREVSELLPYTAKMVDDLTVIRSMWTEAINHDPAITYINTGDQLPGKASLGSWLSYGLGSANDNLPSFVVMTPRWTGRSDAQALYQRLWGSGFLPSKYQGVALRSAGDPVLFLSNPPGVSRTQRRRMLDALSKINHETLAETGDPETRTRIAQYEMAFRMQRSVPELTDLKSEKKSTLDLYGPEVSTKGTFAHSAIMARRMVEKGVRFVQIFHRGWDQHFNIAGHLPKQCKDVDQPSYGLIQDLKQRGLLDDTLVIWGGEFGRTIYCQGQLTKKNYGRDHHPGCFTIWMAGGGIKKGHLRGQTDDYGCNIVDASGKPTLKFEDGATHIRDLNATILHLMGLDHERFTYPYLGLDQRLTGVEGGQTITDIIA